MNTEIQPRRICRLGKEKDKWRKADNLNPTPQDLQNEKQKKVWIAQRRVHARSPMALLTGLNMA
jgi:hypothetical protein